MNKLKRTLPLSLRIIGITVILVAASLGMMSLLLTDQISRGVSETQEQNLEQSVLLASRFMESDLQSAVKTLQDLARNARDGEGRIALPREARDIAGKDGLQGILLLDQARKVRESWPRNLTPPPARALDVPEGAAPVSGVPVWGSAYRENPESPILLPLMQVLSAQGDEETLSLAILVDLDNLYRNTVADQVYGHQGYPFIGDSQGRILSHPRPEFAFTDQRGVIFMDGVLTAIRAGRFREIIPYPWEGKAKHLAFSLIGTTGLFVAATVYDDDLFALAVEMNRTLLMIGGAFLAGITLCLILAIIFFITRPLGKLTNTLARGSDNLESASQQISASSEELSAGSSELAASVEEISASLEELESVVELNTKNINESELLMKDTNAGSQDVSQRMEVLSKALKDIAASSDEIVNITGVIEDIAFQTNILALNAAVEAGRAGEAGKGFSVVADQVKDLSQKSAAAAKETTKLIRTALKNIDRGEKLGEEVMDIQRKAAQMSSHVSTLLDEVNRASQEQMKGIKQINIAINQTNSVVQQTASSAEETASASEQLYGQAEELNGAVALLSRMIKGKARDSSARKSSGAGKKSGRTGRKNHAEPVPDDEEDEAQPDHLEKVSGDGHKHAAKDRKTEPFDPDKLIPMDGTFEDM